jgi:hypothetical protein
MIFKVYKKTSTFCFYYFEAARADLGFGAIEDVFSR